MARRPSGDGLKSGPHRRENPLLRQQLGLDLVIRLAECLGGN